MKISKRRIIVFLMATLAWLVLEFVFNRLSAAAIARALAAGLAAAVVAALLRRGLAKLQPAAKKSVGVGAAGFAAVGVTLLAGWLWFTPLGLDPLVSAPHPAANFEEAAARIEALQAQDGAEINPVCRTRFLSHGRKTEKTIVLLHGLSNCPEQFGPLGDIFFNLGYTVLIPRFPHHGYSDRMTTAQENLTAEELARFGDEVADIAQGLGDEVIVTGFSMGGALTAWLAQQRSDIDRAVLIAPALGLGTIPADTTDAFAAGLLELPNFFMWWDPRLKEEMPPEHGYPRFASHALGQLLRLGAKTRQLAAQSPPATTDFLLITNENDLAVNNGLVDAQGQVWQSGGANVQTYTFPHNLGLEHDLIDTQSRTQQIERVYPILVELIDGAPAAAGLR